MIASDFFEVKNEGYGAYDCARPERKTGGVFVRPFFARG